MAFTNHDTVKCTVFFFFLRYCYVFDSISCQACPKIVAENCIVVNPVEETFFSKQYILVLTFKMNGFFCSMLGEPYDLIINHVFCKLSQSMTNYCHCISQFLSLQKDLKHVLFGCGLWHF